MSGLGCSFLRKPDEETDAGSYCHMKGSVSSISKNKAAKNLENCHESKNASKESPFAEGKCLSQARGLWYMLSSGSMVMWTIISEQFFKNVSSTLWLSTRVLYINAKLCCTQSTSLRRYVPIYATERQGLRQCELDRQYSVICDNEANAVLIKQPFSHSKSVKVCFVCYFKP